MEHNEIIEFRNAVLDEALTLTGVVNRKHCTFEGWYKDGQFTEEIKEIPAGTYGKASSNSTQTCTLNSIVNELRALLGVTVEPILNRKLLAKGYTYNEAYDQYFFTFKGKTRYIVNSTFPRISKERISPAIKSAQYEILLNRIEEWSDACGAQ